MDSFTSYNSKTRHEYDSSFPPRFSGSGVEKTYIHRLAEQRRNKAGEAEIDIFSADKYFNGNMDGEEDKARKVARRGYQDKKPVLVHGDGNTKPRLEARTPSVHSESSWNSQSGLLRSKRDQSKTKAKAPKKKFLANYCKCACSDKDSVDVEDYGECYKQNGKEVRVLDPADLTGIKSLSFNGVVEKQPQQENGSRRLSIEKKMSMLAWDAIPNTEIQGPINGQDSESEGSSELFEIECLSCLENPVVNGGRQSSCVSPTNGYAPSEASVAWSVVTAPAADSSLLSDSQHQLALPPKPNNKPTARGNELPKAHYGGMLSGCNSQKAVRVADTAGGARVKRSESFRNVRHFQYRKDLF